MKVQLLDAVRRVEREGLGGVDAVQHRALLAVEGLVDAQAVALAVLHLRAGDDELPIAGGLDELVHVVAGRHDLLEGRCGDLGGLQGLGLKEVHDGCSRAADGVAHVGMAARYMSTIRGQRPEAMATSLPAASASSMAATEEGSTSFLESSSVPSMSKAMSW